MTLWSCPADLSQHLQQISTAWQYLDPLPTGYLVTNVVNLLMELNLKQGNWELGA
jgi:hypothetical protein